MRNSKTHLNGSASSKGHGLSHKRSGFLSRISLGCASVNSFDSDEFSPEVSKLVNEKMISVDHLYQPRTFVSSVAYAPVTAYLDSNEEEKAFEAFLQEYPGEVALTLVSSSRSSFRVRVSTDLDTGYSSPYRLCSARTCRRNLRRLYGRISLPGESNQGPYWFFERQHSRKHTFCQQYVSICTFYNSGFILIYECILVPNCP